MKYALVGTLFLAATASGADPVPLYNRDVRPILADNCFACHGPDSAARKANLRLDQRDAAVKAEAIVPGKPDASEMIARIFSKESDQLMPPAKSHKTLTPKQKDTLKRWVAAGAEYQPHWSFIAPKRPPVPTPSDPKWVRNPVDAFVLAQLDRAGLKPAPEADRRTLARRLSLDLTGLPPAPVDVEAFVEDKSPDAYEKFVEKLMASPHWGEHRGRYWLDAARYADTHGIHFDNFREIWAYRDWVIAAFNRNQPFDRFTIEQLAGDLLPNPTLDQKVASGFNRCNITTNEGGAIAEEYLVLYTRDRTETTSQVWMGLTTGCAVCHDHKFDPVSQREFYELAAFFNNTSQSAMDGNIKDTPPILPVPRVEDRPRWEKIAAEIAAAKAALEARRTVARPEFDKWLLTAKPKEPGSEMPTGALMSASLSEGSGEEVRVTVGGKERTLKVPGVEWKAGKVAPKALQLRPGGTVELSDVGDFDKTQAFSVGVWVQIPKRGQIGALVARMDTGNNYRGWDVWMEGDRVGMHIVNRWNEDAIKVLGQTPLKPGTWHHIAVAYDGSMKAKGIQVYINGEAQRIEVLNDNLTQTTKTTVPFKVGQRHGAERLQGVLLQDLHLFGRAITRNEAIQLSKSNRIADLLAKAPEKRSAGEKDELYSWWLTGHDDVFQAADKKANALQAEETALRSRGTIAHVMNEKGEPAVAHILFRGEYDKRRDAVKPATPQVLPAMPSDLPRNRLGFAQWLLRPDHPLTARVTVNRFWQELFGTGLVRSSGDFGVTGELPTHPELLDWLAVEFREGGWDVKTFFKMLVTSATYRQAAIATPEKLTKDEANRLLSRGPRFRMDAEMVRDYALASSGLLVRKLGGPSVKPYMPEGVWEAVAMIGSNTRDYRPDKGENLYRRSMYTFWKRSAPPAQMEILNAPNRETCVVRRERTNTPLQALLTLNDLQFVEAARRLAEATMKEGGTAVDSRVDFMTKRLLARSLRADELAVVRASFAELAGYYKGHADDAKKLIAVGESKADPKLDAADLAAWTMLANQLLNLDEVLNK